MTSPLMEDAAAKLVAAILQDPSAKSASKRYHFAQLHASSGQNPTSGLTANTCNEDLTSGLAFCQKLDSSGTTVVSDVSLSAWWEQQSRRRAAQAVHRDLARHFVKNLMAESLASNTDGFVGESDMTPASVCAECEAAQSTESEEMPEPPQTLPPAPRKLRPINIEVLKRPVTPQEVKKALSHIAAHAPLSVQIRSEASCILDQSTAVSNFATALGAILESAGALWRWGECAGSKPHRHAVHGLKKCRMFSEPTAVLMLTFLEILSARLLPEVAKSLNPLQRWRHKHEVKSSTSKVRATLASTQARSKRVVQQALQARVENLQAMRLRLRQRFDFPLSQGFCYDGAGEAFGKLFAGLRIEVDLCKACFCSPIPELSADALRKQGESDSSSDDEDDLDHAPQEYELVGEALTVIKADLRCCGSTMPHNLILHCLRSLGFGPEWLGFFKVFLEAPLPSGRQTKRGMPLGSSLSTLLLEIVCSFLDLWLHADLFQQSKVCKSAHMAVPLRHGEKVAAASPEGPVLASLRCGDDVWLITRAPDASMVWARLKELHIKCGLILNMEDSGSVTLGGAQVDKSSISELEQRPCWSLLQLTPNGSWRVAGWRLAPRIARALAEIEAPGPSLFQRIRIFNRHVDALLRQGGFHEDLREALQPLHVCISSMFDKAAEEGFNSLALGVEAAPAKLDKSSFGALLSSLLWWPRQSGGLGARHIFIALHGEENRIAPLVPADLCSGQPLEQHVQSALQLAPARSDRYESRLQMLFASLIQDTFGTTTVLDSRYTALLI